MSTRPRQHNEWFRTVSLGGRKSCPECLSKLEPGEFIWSHGEYVRAKWRTVTHFCKNCFDYKVRGALVAHTSGCGCTVNLCQKGPEPLPDWLSLTPMCATH